MAKTRHAPAAFQRTSSPFPAKAEGTRRPRLTVAEFVVLLCFLGSGLTGLIYEVVWTRMITNVIGGAPFAVAIVVTIFMGGIGAGSYLAGKVVDRYQDARALARWYGVLELIIGAYALLVPLLIATLQPVQAWIYRRFFEQFLLFNFFTFAVCGVVLAVPVLCMGATLPVLCRYRIRELKSVGAGAGLLYGLNTVGAAAGAWLGGMWLVPRLGVNGTLAAAVVINAVIGVAALRLVGRSPVASPTRLSSAVPREPVAAEIAEDRNQLAAAGALLIFGVSGFCSMSYEVIWTRLLSLIVGPTNYSFTIILVTFISGLALGSFVSGWLTDRVGRPETLLVATQIAAALLALLVSQWLGGSQLFFAKLTLAFKDQFATQNAMKALILFGVLIPPTLCLGATFPLVSKVCARTLANVGRTLGFAYAINSAGAVLGSLAAGFVLIPLAGKERGLSVVIVFQLVAALAGAAIMRKRMALSPFLRTVGATAAVAGLAGTLVLPRWNHRVLASSKYHRLDELRPLLNSSGWFAAWFHGPQILARHDRNELLYYGEGVGGFTTVCRTPDALGGAELWMANSGKFDASSRGDMNTEVLLAHLPMVFHANPRAVLVVGLASGVTAGEVLHYPIEQLDVLEINEQAARASDFFAAWNNRVLANPKTRLILQDARAHLRLARRTYDVVISEPSNPWMAGCASLFTREFFRDVRDRLADGGVFAQWLHAYEIDWESIELIGRTFLDVFPNAALISTSPTQVGSDYLLVGFKNDAGLRAENALRNAPHLRKSSNLVLSDPRLLYRMVVSDDCTGTFGPGPLNTDNRPLLEFNAPRQLHRSRAAASQVIARLLETPGRSSALKRHLESFAGSIDAQLDYAEFALSLYEPFAGMFDPATATAEQSARFAALMRRYCESNQIDVALIAGRALRDQCIARQLEIIQSRTGANSGDEQTCSYRAGLLKAIGQPQAALEEYRRCVRLNPANVQALNEAGILLAQSGQTEEAMSQFKQVLRIDPEQPEAHANLATAYYNSGNALLAEVHFREALRLDPDLQEAREGLRFLQSRKRR